MEKNTKNKNVKNRLIMISVASLVLVLGLISYVALSTSYRQLKNEYKDNDPNVENIVNNDNDNEIVNKPIQGVKADPTEEKEKTPEKEVKANTSISSDKECVMPCNGEVGTEFSLDALVFSQTMDDWRIHTGVDIKGEQGEDIVSIKNGTVQDVYYDEMMGYTVSVKHMDGAISVYSNLENSIAVSAGDKVSAGDVLGQIGCSAMLEGEEDPHLHLEIIKDEAHIDPIEYINQQN